MLYGTAENILKLSPVLLVSYAQCNKSCMIKAIFSFSPIY